MLSASQAIGHVSIMLVSFLALVPSFFVPYPEAQYGQRFIQQPVCCTLNDNNTRAGSLVTGTVASNMTIPFSISFTDASDSSGLGPGLGRSGTAVPTGLLTGSLTMPSGWINSATAVMSFTATLSGADLDSGSLSNDANLWGPDIPIRNGQLATTTWSLDGDGANKPVFLRLRDNIGRTAVVVSGTVNVDTTPPVSFMTPLAPYSPRSFAISWSGTDTTSGISVYDVQVRVGEDTAWTPWLTGSTLTSAVYEGAPGEAYAFRVRAIDAAGNVEPWREEDTSTSIPQTD